MALCLLIEMPMPRLLWASQRMNRFGGDRSFNWRWQIAIRNDRMKVPIKVKRKASSIRIGSMLVDGRRL